ncbi:MAG: hypothetical protein Q8P55_00340 [bacterium]|nr:hypothetical protein [bacterium]
MEEPRFFNKEAWKGIAIAILAVVAGQLVLAWQYYRLEENRLPLIEQQLAEQRQEIERQAAKKSLVSFLDALEQGNANLAIRFLTENAFLQEEQGTFSLKEPISSYKIVELQQVGASEFRAQVDIEKQAPPSQLHLLRVLKVLDTYYIDSFEMAG